MLFGSMRKLYPLLFAFLVLPIGFIANAQPGDPPPTVPISGIEWLLVAGGAAGVRRLYNKSKLKR